MFLELHIDTNITDHLDIKSTGLFNKVIIQSGGGFCRIGYFGPDVARGIAKEFAIKIGCPSVNSSQDMYECFMAMDPNITPIVQESMYVSDIRTFPAFFSSLTATKKVSF